MNQLCQTVCPVRQECRRLDDVLQSEYQGAEQAEIVASQNFESAGLRRLNLLRKAVDRDATADDLQRTIAAADERERRTYTVTEIEYYRSLRDDAVRRSEELVGALGTLASSVMELVIGEAACPGPSRSIKGDRCRNPESRSVKHALRDIAKFVA